MKTGKKLLVMTGAILFILAGIAATTPPDNGFTNLKVLPKNISKQHLDHIMDEFKAALGVKCNFCHVQQKDNPDNWDWASDQKPEKNIARKMISMSNKINKKFFHGKSKYGQENAVLEIHCVTCHHGSAHPEILDEERQDHD